MAQVADITLKWTLQEQNLQKELWDAAQDVCLHKQGKLRLKTAQELLNKL